MKKKKLTIIDDTPYGYLIDSYKWSEYLNDEYNVRFLTHSRRNTKKIENKTAGMKISYARHWSNHFFDNRLFILKCWFYLFFHKGPVIVEWFRHCELLKKWAPRRKMILDIRTLSVAKNEKVRVLKDKQLKDSCMAFDTVTVISEGVKKKLALKNKDVRILPLGSDIISTKKKDYSRLDLLYVGVFMGRNIEMTLEGVKLFQQKHPDAPLSYNIIGGETKAILDYMKERSEHLGLRDIVKFHGFMHHDDLPSYFDEANIGVSFVPMTAYYDAQPATKTFEYSNSGLYVIGTSTTENKKCIDADNGVLIQDNPESFAEGLEKIWEHRTEIDEEKVRARLEEYTWKNIVNSYLKPVIENNDYICNPE